MAYNGIQANGLYGQQQLVPGDFVSGEQYRYALANFRIAHEKVESQRKQLEEQERQVAQLRERIATLEGDDDQSRWQKIGEKAGGSSVDDFSIKNTASQLEKQINRWAAEVVRLPPAPLEEVYDALLEDILNGEQPPALDPQPMVVQNLLRHIMSEMISEGVINCLIVTNSQEANLHVTRIHEHIFDRDPTVASVWRRQTFTAAVENCSTEMTGLIISEHMPSLEQLLLDNLKAMHDILNSAYSFSRMLHGSKSTTSGMGDAFYRAFVPELSVVLSPRQVELVKRCVRSERNEVCRVGACVFPGLVKVTQIEGQQNVVRKAHVVCECALSSRNV
ncbi:hypothetical protein Clacol_003812 [Clathrus columnatus]|uniref:Uncharacterized protein n=1 Tax=Clathrus columnatus TaxID=1419009 RepID=A0AAV5A8M3_9AGAM|nr:hypothetical protein Clacol_003812 [Clathrus columnatus]